MDGDKRQQWEAMLRRRKAGGADAPAVDQAAVAPVWEDGDKPVSIDPAHIIPTHQKRDITEDLSRVEDRIRQGIAGEVASMLGKSGINIDTKALTEAVKSGGSPRPELAGAHAALAEQLSKGDFQKVIADFMELGSTKDGGTVSADNMFLDMLAAAGGSVERDSDATIGDAAQKATDRELKTNRVKIYGGKALVASAIGANVLLFIVDVAIAKSILDYGLASAASYVGPDLRNGMSWFFALLSQGYLLYGKSRPEILNPKTTSGKANLTAFAAIGLVAVGMLSAKVIGSREQAEIAVKVGEQFKTKAGAVETGVTGLQTQVRGILPSIEPLIKEKARAAAAEGSKGADAAQQLEAQITTAQKTLDAARNRLKGAPDNAARKRAVSAAEAAYDRLVAQREKLVRPAPPEGADPEPNGPKSYTAWRVTYGLNHLVGGKTVKSYTEQPGFPAEFGGFTVAKTDAAMLEIEAEFKLQPGEGMIALLQRLNGEVSALDMSTLLTEKGKLIPLIEQLKPNEWRYILGPLYTVAIEWDLKAALKGEASVEDLFARQPELLKAARPIAQALAKIKVQQDLIRYQQMVKERIGLDLGIEFPPMKFSLTEDDVNAWEVKRKDFAHILDRGNYYYLKQLGTEHLPTITAVLTVFFAGLFLVMGAKRQRSRWREDNLSGFEAQEFAREEMVAKALVEDLEKRESSVHRKLERVFGEVPRITVSGQEISIDVSEAPAQRSTERLDEIIRRGMRIAALKSLQKPADMTDEEFVELKKAFVERRPRKGLFGERSQRAHLGSEELARAYNASLDQWIARIAGPDKESALKDIRAEVTAFDGPNTNRDAALDRLELQLEKRVYSAGQARDLYGIMDAPFRKAEAEAILARVRTLAAQRDALRSAGAGRTLVLDGNDSLTARDILYTDILGEVETDLNHYVELYKSVVGESADLDSALAEGNDLSSAARAEYAKRLEAVYGSERQDAWKGQTLSEVADANDRILKSVGARASGTLAGRAKVILGVPADSHYSVKFEFPYENAFSGRLLEINLYNADGTEVASLTYPNRIPSPELDSDEKILKAIEAFLSEDSLELQIAKGEAKYSAMTEQILALLEGLPEEIDVAGMDDDTARRIDELLLKKDIADEQNIAIDTFLRKGSKLTAQQAVLFGDAPENAQFSRFWRSGTKSAIERVLAQNAGKTVLFRPSEGIFVVKSGDTEEKRIAIREA